MSADVVEYVESEKLCQPSMYTSELQQRLLLDGISPLGHMPSRSAIKKVPTGRLQNDKEKGVPSTQRIVVTSKYGIHRLFPWPNWTTWLYETSFFDECSVLVTSGNRAYGNSYIGEPAIEIQRYASNANYTLNLLHSVHGVDYFNVLRGPSNGMELLNFFNEALSVNRVDGSTILENGDVVIMDNCGFYHGQFAETVLRDILQEHGVDLIFQQVY